MSAVTHGRGRMPWIVGTVVVLHGLLHLLGAAKGLGWFTVSSLSQPIGPRAGGIWLVVALLVVLAGLLLALAARWWWVVGGVAAVASQAVIATSWTDARAGTAINVLLLGAAVYGWASQGPHSLSREYQRRVSTALYAAPAPLADSGPVVTEQDLATLPTSVAAYVQRTGAVGRARVTSLRAHLQGRIRASATSTWMPFTGEQVNTYGPPPAGCPGAGWARLRPFTCRQPTCGGAATPPSAARRPSGPGITRAAPTGSSRSTRGTGYPNCARRSSPMPSSTG